MSVVIKSTAAEVTAEFGERPNGIDLLPGANLVQIGRQHASIWIADESELEEVRKPVDLRCA